jgi:hypothetical protein
MNNLNDAERLKQYLLGNLSATEMEAIDLRIISDDDFEENMLIAENDLIEDFFEGALTDTEISLFRKNFLISNDRKIQVRNVGQLKQYAVNYDFDKTSKESETEDNFFLRLSAALRLRSVQAFAAVLIIGLVGSFVWFGYFANSSTLNSLESEFAVLNQEKFNDLSKYEDLSRLILMNGNTRGSGDSNVLLREKLTENVLFNLALRTDSTAVEKYKFELIKNKKVIFTQPDLPTYKNEFGEELRFIIPSKILELGEYLIIITSTTDENNKLTYSFTVK